MRILVDIGHPAHVHFYKNFIWEMENRGHELLVTARDKDVALPLLKEYRIEYTYVGRMGNNKFALIKEWIKRDQEIYSIAKRFRPDILTGIHNPCVAHVSKLTAAKSIIFTDSERTKLANMIIFPFADIICTPACFKNNLGKKQVRYNGYHELAYLHPNYFKPNHSVLDELGIRETDKYVVVRFVSWGASHDIGHRGFDLVTKRKLVQEIGKYGRVLITSEVPLPEEFEQYKLSVSPETLHNLLYYASLCISEGATTATEAAILGTPSIHFSAIAQNYGNFEDLAGKFGLIYIYSGQEQAFQKAIELVSNKDSKKEWQHRREKMLSDKIDVTRFVVDFIENYPRSFDEIKEKR